METYKVYVFLEAVMYPAKWEIEANSLAHLKRKLKKRRGEFVGNAEIKTPEGLTKWYKPRT